MEINTSCTVHIYCHTSKREQIDLFTISESPPVESGLDQYLSDYLNFSISSSSSKTRQEFIGLLEPSLLFLRLLKNPNFYGLVDVTQDAVSSFLSELIDDSVNLLQSTNCVSVTDSQAIIPDNNGIIASHYLISINSIQSILQQLSSTSRLRGCFESIRLVEEFSNFPVRHGEYEILRNLNLSLPYPQKGSLTDGGSKILIILLARISRMDIPKVFSQDLTSSLPQLLSFFHSLVDILAAKGWLLATLSAMELSRFTVQRMFQDQNHVTSPLLQLPYFDNDTIVKAKTKFGCQISDESRDLLLEGFSPEQIETIADFSNSLPIIEVNCDNTITGPSGSHQSFLIEVARDAPVGSDHVFAIDLPFAKPEFWWFCLASRESNTVLALKRVRIETEVAVNLKFLMPTIKKDLDGVLFVISDSYIGLDQEIDLKIVST
ncbi:hypothetical protein GEMRC1_002800 [Eukaryota sp. GEM-RC1]